MEFLLFIFLLYLLYSQFSLRNRIDELEDRFRRSRRDATEVHLTPPTISPIPRAPQVSDVVEYAPTSNSEATPLPEAPRYSPSFEQNVGSLSPEEITPLYRPVEAGRHEAPGEFFLYTWFKEQTLIKIGAIIFFFGAVWFVSYAIEQNWISPFTRIFLGLLLALAVYAAGYLRRATTKIQYQVLTTLGTGILLGTVIASQFAFVIPVLPANIAFLLMVAGIAYTVLAAVLTKTEWLGTTAAVAGFLVPLLVASPDPSLALRLTYILVLSACLSAVVFLTAWRSLSLTLLLGSALYLSSAYNDPLFSPDLLWFFVLLF